MIEHKSLTEALAAFQADLPDVSKGSTNPAFNSKYADLADVVKAVLPKLAEHGLAWITAPDRTKQGLVLRYELRHVSGESFTGVWPLPESSNAQQLGSWITYGRRYALSAVTGIAPDADDDGNAATGKVTSRPAARAPRASRAQTTNDNVATALAGLAKCEDAGTLDQIEQWATKVGIAGVESVAKAIAGKRAELGTPDRSSAWDPVEGDPGATTALTNDEYEQQASAEFDAAVAAGEA